MDDAEKERIHAENVEFAKSLGITNADVQQLARRMDDPVGRKMIARRLPAPTVQFPHL